jgi:hypothetical protein
MPDRAIATADLSPRPDKGDRFGEVVDSVLRVARYSLACKPLVVRKGLRIGWLLDNRVPDGFLPINLIGVPLFLATVPLKI